MKIFALLFAIAALLPACQTTEMPDALTTIVPPPHRTYEQRDAQKMQWLAGMWQSTATRSPMQMLFQFHQQNALEVADLSASSSHSVSGWLVWQNSRYYFGDSRQWVVTWIGEKDIRLDPAQPGSAVQPMSWVRQSNDRWLLVRHLRSGDEVTTMERTGGSQP